MLYLGRGDRGACSLFARLQRRLQRVVCCLNLFAFSVQLSDAAISVLLRAVVRLPEATNLRNATQMADNAAGMQARFFCPEPNLSVQPY